MKEKNKGITLIALVVTIVVLLILAGVSIAMLTGDNGIIAQSQKAKDNTEQAKVEEHVSVAIGSLITKFNGEINGITPKMIADQINEDENRSDVYAENETTFPTYIIFPKENRKAEANLKAGNDIVDDSIYNASVSESDIAPKDLYDYEIIDNGETGSLSLDNLPTRTVKITRIKPEFCNTGGYNPDTREYDLTDTNYEIIYNGTKISETLIVPYQVDGKYIPGGIEGEMYRVVGVCLSVSETYGLPKVKKIIFPNTVLEVSGKNGGNGNDTIQEIVLPKYIKTIGSKAFRACKALTTVKIPDEVTSIGSCAFSYCSSLKEITIPDSVTNISNDAFQGCGGLTSIIVSNENSVYDSRNNCNAIIETSTNKLIQGCCKTIIPNEVTSINDHAFSDCKGLTNITIPESVTSIDDYAFEDCKSLEEIIIPNSVINMGTGAFLRCTELTTITLSNNLTSIKRSTFWNCSKLTSIEIPDGVNSIEGNAFFQCESLKIITIPESVTDIETSAFGNCWSLLIVNYKGTEEQWNKISISPNETELIRAEKIYNYK